MGNKLANIETNPEPPQDTSDWDWKSKVETNS